MLRPFLQSRQTYRILIDLPVTGDLLFNSGDLGHAGGHAGDKAKGYEALKHAAQEVERPS